jgi:hypothetical protein
VAGSPALPELSGANYARTHAAYEAASDQRAGLQAWLPRELPSLLGAGPLQVLGVGVGDGSIDAPLAAALAADGREVRYTGVEPHAASAAGFAARLVHFVHSLYYMADLRATLDQALAMLRPGGLLVAATAPREPLCVLTDLLSPGTGHRLWCAEDVTAELESRGLVLQSETMVAGLDLGDVHIDPHGVGELVLDFLVGARTSVMSVEVREQVMYPFLRRYGPNVVDVFCSDPDVSIKD